MKRENQVCSQDLSVKLKKLGVPQNAYWTWYENAVKFELMHNPKGCRGLENKSFDAFSVAELGEMLPNENFETSKVLITGFNDKTRWETRTFRGGVVTHYEEEKTEADARAKMLIHLLENKLIKK